MIIKLLVCGFFSFGLGVFLTATISSIKINHYCNEAEKWYKKYLDTQKDKSEV